MTGDTRNRELPPELEGYRLLEKIGQGGMGVVWKARDRGLKRIVAIKILRPEIACDELRRRRFLEEARLTASISDGGVVHVYALERSGDRDIIVMEYVDGEPLRARLPGNPLPPEQVIDLGWPIARALSRVHRHGLVHRDLKPENVLVSGEGDVKVVDFGIAILLEPWLQTGDTTMTDLSGPAPRVDAPRLCGTAAYMSPEQARGEEVDARSDIFSLGVMLYEMTTGRRPFQCPTLHETLEAVRAARPIPPHDLVSILPLDLERIVTKALSRRRQERYQTMDDLAVDLKHLGQELESGSWARWDDRGCELPPDPGTFVVLPAEVHGVDEDSEFVGVAFADGVASNLARGGSPRVLPTPEPVPSGGDERADDAALGRDLGAGRVVRIVLSRDEARARVRVRVVDTIENRILWAGSQEWPRMDLDGLDEAVARDVASGLGLQRSGPAYGMPIELVANPRIAAIPEGVRAIAALMRLAPDEPDAARRLVEQLPDEPDAYSLLVAALARAYFRDPRAEAGLELHEAACALEVLDPIHPLADLTRAYLFLQRGKQIDLSLRIWNRLVERDDLSPLLRAHTLRNRAWGKLRVLDLDGALRDLDEALTLSPVSAAVLGMLANALSQAGRHDEALRRARQALAIYPFGIASHLDVGVCLRAEKRWKEALPYYETVVERGRAQVTLGCYAVVAHRAGRTDDGRSAANDAVQCTDSVTGQYALACYHAVIGEPEEAMRLLKSSLDLGLSHGQMLQDPDLDALRGRADFEQIEAEVSRRIGR